MIYEINKHVLLEEFFFNSSIIEFKNVHQSPEFLKLYNAHKSDFNNTDFKNGVTTVYLDNVYLGYFEIDPLDGFLEDEAKWYPKLIKNLNQMNLYANDYILSFMGHRHNLINHHFGNKSYEFFKYFIETSEDFMKKLINYSKSTKFLKDYNEILFVISDEEFFDTGTLKKLNKEFPNKTKLIKENHANILIIRPIKN